MITEQVKQRIEKGLRELDAKKFEALEDHKRIAVVMYYADTPMTASEIAPYVGLPTTKVKQILEASL